MPAETLGKPDSECRIDLLDRIIETAGKSSLVLTIQANSEESLAEGAQERAPTPPKQRVDLQGNEEPSV